jgi:hypothetical protein
VQQYLRNTLYPLLAEEDASAPSDPDEDSFPFAALFDIPLSYKIRHVGHCFDFLRTSIQCCGDMTLEWASNNTEFVKAPHVDGHGVTHKTCKDWVSYSPICAWYGISYLEHR